MMTFPDIFLLEKNRLRIEIENLLALDYNKSEIIEINMKLKYNGDDRGDVLYVDAVSSVPYL